MDFNIKRINKKIVLYLSLIGFVLSFFSGLLSGNRFGTLFIRSVFSGIVVGVVIIIVNIIIMIYLPELIETEENDDLEDGDGDSHVNIVMPEEEYKVQSGDNDFSEDDNNDFDGDDNNSSFKEVGLDNLKNLSSSLNEGYTNEVENYGDDSGSFSQSSSKSGNSKMENHSVEDMAKAVKTVLKKD